MADTNIDSLVCSLAGEKSSGEIPTSQSVYQSLVQKRNSSASYNVGSFNADPVVGSDLQTNYNIQLIYSFNKESLVIESSI